MNALQIVNQVKKIDGTDLYSLRSVVEAAQQFDAKINYKSVRASLRPNKESKIGNDYGLDMHGVSLAFACALKDHPDLKAKMQKAVESLDGANKTETVKATPVKTTVESKANSLFNNYSDNALQAAKPTFFINYSHVGHKCEPVSFKVSLGFNNDATECGGFNFNYLVDVLTRSEPQIFSSGKFLSIWGPWHESYNAFEWACKDASGMASASLIRASALPEFLYGAISFAYRNYYEYIAAEHDEIAELLAEALALAEIAPLDTYKGLSIGELMDKCQDFYSKTFASKLDSTVDANKMRITIDKRIAKYALEVYKAARIA